MVCTFVFSFSKEAFSPNSPSFRFLSFFLLNVLVIYRRKIFLVFSFLRLCFITCNYHFANITSTEFKKNCESALATNFGRRISSSRWEPRLYCIYWKRYCKTFYEIFCKVEYVVNRHHWLFWNTLKTLLWVNLCKNNNFFHQKQPISINCHPCLSFFRRLKLIKMYR